MEDDATSLADHTPSPDDAPFRHYSLRHRATAWISHNLFDWCTYTVRHGLIRGMRRKGGLGWLPHFLSSGVATDEHAFWESLRLSGLIVYDVGAFHGILTLFFANRCAQVISYEPNTRNYLRLLENVQLNGLTNVMVRKLGLGSRPGTGVLVYAPLMSGGGSLNSAPSTRSNMRQESETIAISSFDTDLASGLPVPDLIKIDVEGYELEVLRGAAHTLATHHPALFLEMHGETMNEKRRKVSELVSFLVEAGYRNILHVESGESITLLNSSVAAEGHLYCVAV
ncbi:MAG: FkbM family methyltransferase [Bryobacteraceae bacterium]|jgi:FkbM family methyltransferase